MGKEKVHRRKQPSSWEQRPKDSRSWYPVCTFLWQQIISGTF